MTENKKRKRRGAIQPLSERGKIDPGRPDPLSGNGCRERHHHLAGVPACGGGRDGAGAGPRRHRRRAVPGADYRGGLLHRHPCPVFRFDCRAADGLLRDPADRPGQRRADPGHPGAGHDDPDAGRPLCRRGRDVRLPRAERVRGRTSGSLPAMCGPTGF